MPELKNAISDLGKRLVDGGECFGGAAAVIEDGSVTANIHFGDSRFVSDSLYRLASVTKLFTATAVMKLYEEKKLDIYAPVTDYIPAFSKITLGRISSDGSIASVGKSARHFTLFELLTHTAGLGVGELGSREYALLPSDAKTSLESVTGYYADNFHLAFKPGEKAAYSGFAGYDVLARIVETVSKMTFNDYLQNEICRPLGLTDTTFQPSDSQYARLVPMHKRVSGENREIDFRGTLFRGIPRTYEAAGASLISSAEDIIRFCRMLVTGEGVISKEGISLMLNPMLDGSLDGLAEGENNCFGCFAVVGDHRLPKGTVYSHGAYGTHVLLEPKRKFAAILLVNSLSDMSTAPHSATEFEKIVIKR